jgi:hypothetical protein
MSHDETLSVSLRAQPGRVKPRRRECSGMTSGRQAVESDECVALRDFSGCRRHRFG